MTSRDRWLCLLAKRTPDRIPTDYQATSEVTNRLLDDLSCRTHDELWKKLNIDKRRELKPRWKRGDDSADAMTDIWGVRYTRISYGTGSYREAATHPLANAQSVADIDAYPWPSADDFDYDCIGTSLANDDGQYPIHGGWFEPFLLYAYLRGLERAFEDLVCEPEIADAILAHLFEFHYERDRRVYEAGRGKIDVTYIAEDLGSQSGPLISLEMYRRFLLPNQIRMADLARKHGVHIMYHTDGAARIFLPDLIERVGIELLNPIQWRCAGMERESLVRDFGKDIIFHGSIDNQQTLAFGSVGDVVKEVEESVKIYERARWICAPCHNFQPITPTRNIVAMYETIHRLGRCS
jgi:uroporphyrinogen decarboxylase